MKSVRSGSIFGQKIESRKIPQELFKEGIQIPVPVIRTLIETFVKDLRFSCHNLYSQHFFWACLWFILTVFLWSGIPISIGNMPLGMILILCYLVPFLIHMFSCCACRAWRKHPVYDKLGQLNHQLSDYNCLATVRNSKLGCSFHLTFFYYNVGPCIDHLVDRLDRSWGQAPIPQQQGYEMTQPSCIQQQQRREYFQNYAKSLLMSHSAEYLYQFLDEVLPEVTSQRHTIQLSCLCQYVEHKTAGTNVHIVPNLMGIVRTV